MTSPAPDYQTPERMAAKLKAMPPLSVAGKRVLDVGTDFGAWCFYSARNGAVDVLGLDRNREVRGVGPVDLIARNRAQAEAECSPCRFEHIDVGRQWREFGRFDLVLVLSVYHHIYEAAGGDHVPVWYWLHRHCALDAELLWEGPVDDTDPVVRANVSAANRARYTKKDILNAARLYFEAEYVGPAIHEPTREVWRFKPLMRDALCDVGRAQSGAGGATKAFEHAGGRRMDEIETALGVRPIPGSLNVRMDDPFRWHVDYYRAQVLDVAERGKGLDVEWAPRWARFYPVRVSLAGVPAYAFRFEGEKYSPNFVELIAPTCLRDMCYGDLVSICQ